MYSRVVPVALDKATGFVDTIENNIDGVLVGKDDVREYSKVVLNLLKNEELLKSMKKTAKEKAEKFRLEIIIDKIQDLYKSLINRKQNLGEQ